MKTVETTFRISFTEDQYRDAIRFVEDMRKHPQRVYWKFNKGKTNEELAYAYIAHRILSGYYNRYSPRAAHQILDMKNTQP